MNYADIKVMDVGDGPGIRTSLFVSGCEHYCEKCFNSEAWDFNYGKPYTSETEAEIITLLKPDYITGLSILGGEPMHPNNVTKVYDLVTRVKNLYGDKKTIWIYSGYTLEQILRNYCGANGIEVLKYIDVLVDGKYVDKLKDVTLKFRGSSNQRLIDMKRTLLNPIHAILDDKDLIVEFKI